MKKKISQSHQSFWMLWLLLLILAGYALYTGQIKGIQPDNMSNADSIRTFAAGTQQSQRCDWAEGGERRCERGFYCHDPINYLQNTNESCSVGQTCSKLGEICIVRRGVGRCGVPQVPCPTLPGSTECLAVCMPLPQNQCAIIRGNQDCADNQACQENLCVALSDEDQREQEDSGNPDQESKPVISEAEIISQLTMMSMKVDSILGRLRAVLARNPSPLSRSEMNSLSTSIDTVVRSINFVAGATDVSVALRNLDSAINLFETMVGALESR